MELEAKLDEDFLFYLNFTSTFLRRIADREIHHRCRVWLYKLLAEPCEGIQRKRCRNMYLAQLLISMQNGHLERPFLESPHDADIINASEVFGPIPKNIKRPAWLNDNDYDVKGEEAMAERKGRTYIATRTLPNGQGAFAYIGVSLTNEEPMWIGAGESSFDQKLQMKYGEMVPPVYEMEKILARRKDPAEREKVLTFYDVLMQNIADELDGKELTENETVEGLLVQLVHDLTEKDQYHQYDEMDESERRFELLLMLYDRVKARRDKVAKREEVLDEIEERNVAKSFFEVSEGQPEDKYELPAAMWEQAIDKVPTKKQMENMQKAYPFPLIELFLTNLASHKEEIAMRMQRRHENIVTQMKKELRKEGEKKKKMAEEADIACANALLTLEDVKEQYLKMTEAARMNSAKYEMPVSEHTKQYEQMKAAVFDTQKLVEDEAARGKFLAAQINAVSEQTEKFIHVNDDMVTKTEEANMKIMRNIKRLNAAVRQYESRVTDLKSMAANRSKMKGSAFVM